MTIYDFKSLFFVFLGLFLYTHIFFVEGLEKSRLLFSWILRFVTNNARIFARVDVLKEDLNDWIVPKLQSPFLIAFGFCILIDDSIEETEAETSMKNVIRGFHFISLFI